MNEMTIHLESGKNKALYEQIYQHIKNEIQEGSFRPGEKLPSARFLSVHLQVSRSTVDLAYEQLLSEGYIESVPRKGYFISQIDGLYKWSRQEATQQPGCAEAAAVFEYDFSPDGIDLEHFPYNIWRKISKEALAGDNQNLFSPGNPKGDYELRATISSYLHQARGVRCTAQEIIVGAGVDYLLMLLCMILPQVQEIAMESPTYKRAYHVFRAMGKKVVTVGMDDLGMSAWKLEETDASLAYLMPSHQFPLGVVMPLKRRLELLDWACQKENRYLIEDDHDSEFRYRGKPIPALQGYDRKECVIYLGTFSKSIAPSIRISYMVLPKKLRSLYEAKEYLFSNTVSRLDQTFVNNFIDGGYYERHLNKMRTIYKNKHDLLLFGLRKIKNIEKVTGDNAGLHFLVHFYKGKSEEYWISRANMAGVKVYPLSDYNINAKETNEQPVILLGYAGMCEEQLKEALRRLEQAWE